MGNILKFILPQEDPVSKIIRLMRAAIFKYRENPHNLDADRVFNLLNNI